ncbi:MAG: glucuronate isomerase [Lentisphaerae bacterium]|nr:glucuronate isomerase [Lentisphaerota bacterium]
MAFLDRNYLIGNAAGLRIFDAVKDLPIVDAHNHANVKELAENKNYADAWQLFAGTDHYVWSVMRRCGVAEEYITGNRTAREKFCELGRIFPLLVGNPVYEWIHLDLKRVMNIDTLLNGETANEIFDAVNTILAREDMKPLAILKKLNVVAMCSTDDPVDTLEYHRQVNAAWGGILVRPTWRPDAAMNMHLPTWSAYMQKLAARFELTFNSIDDLFKALRMSHDYFAANNCTVSDHGVEIIPGATFDKALADATFKKALSGAAVSKDEITNFQKAVMNCAAALDAEKDWVFQLHFGAMRNVRHSIFEKLGPDTGVDTGNCFQDHYPGMVDFLNAFDGKLKTVLYCFDPTQISTVASVARAFSSKVKIGAPWWQCDNPIGMKRQLEYFGSVDLLNNCSGMVSDSRKLLSYGSRHEMFRRVLADVLGTMAELGQAPEELLTELAVRLCYEQPRSFFAI